MMGQCRELWEQKKSLFSQTGVFSAEKSGVALDEVAYGMRPEG